jgi:DNA-binding MarR family transcriptional regulator
MIRESRSGRKVMSDEESSRAIDAIARDCIAVRLRLLSRVVTSVYDEALRPLGLKVSQLNILVVTGKLGLARPAAVCELLQLDKSTLSRNVERLRAKGWLEVVPGEDARTQPFQLTVKGKKLLERALPAWEEAQHTAGELLGQEGVVRLTRTANRLGRLPGSH